MNKINIRMLGLAFLVIIFFSLVGISIALRNPWLIFLFFILAIFTMAFGMAYKRRKIQ